MYCCFTNALSAETVEFVLLHHRLVKHTIRISDVASYAHLHVAMSSMTLLPLTQMLQM